MTGRITARGVNQALVFGLQLLHKHGERADSRNGPVIVAPTPVLTTYTHPRERVLTSPIRDANPFFHLYESLWMLAGRCDVGPLITYVKRMKEFSDDGKTLAGAYGHRWRHAFTDDQLEFVIEHLYSNPTSRRAVISMWSPDDDPLRVHGNRKDVPCNTHCYVWVDGGRVHMTICCRSNDIIWGAYGANAVHFSFLLEYIACALGRPVGQMYQLSNNFHAYVDVFERTLPLTSLQFVDPYVDSVQPLSPSIPLFEGGYGEFDCELKGFLEGARSTQPFLDKVAAPILYAHTLYRNDASMKDILEVLREIQEHAPDWHAACSQWIVRRKTPA